MSPDLHWRVGEDNELETIAQVSAPSRSQRGWIALLIVVIMGAGLGVVYGSIPEPASLRTPAPSPTPQSTPFVIPAKLYQVIDREAQALADGDAETVVTLHEPQDSSTTAWQRRNLKAWGRPPDHYPLYTIIDFKLRSQTALAMKAWADIRQFRNGRWFRETRFYRWKEDRWLRSEADLFFWSGQTETLDTPYFHVIYAIEDRNLVEPVIDQLEQARQRICADLGCGITSLTYTLTLNSGVNNGWPVSDDSREIRFASPRVMGLYEDASPLSDEGLNLIWTLAWTSAQQVIYGEIPAYADQRASTPLLWAMSSWAATRAADLPNLRLAPDFKAEFREHPLSLETLVGSAAETNNERTYRLAFAIVHFIEQVYGAPAVAKVLKQIATAPSFADVIENGLGMPFTEFDQKWRAWLKQSATPSS